MEQTDEASPSEEQYEHWIVCLTNVCFGLLDFTLTAIHPVIDSSIVCRALRAGEIETLSWVSGAIRELDFSDEFTSAVLTEVASHSPAKVIWREASRNLAYFIDEFRLTDRDLIHAAKVLANDVSSVQGKFTMMESSVYRPYLKVWPLHQLFTQAKYLLESSATLSRAEMQRQVLMVEQRLEHVRWASSDYTSKVMTMLRSLKGEEN